MSSFSSTYQKQGSEKTHLNRSQYGCNIINGTPLVLQDIQANAPICIDWSDQEMHGQECFRIQSKHQHVYFIIYDSSAKTTPIGGSSVDFNLWFNLGIPLVSPIATGAAQGKKNGKAKNRDFKVLTYCSDGTSLRQTEQLEVYQGNPLRTATSI